MTSITFFKAANDRGQDLLDHYVAPLCARHGISLREARANANRGDGVLANRTSTLVLWDCSVEDGNVYNAISVDSKVSPKSVFVSRTPLPRNMLTRFQCAPLHGETFTNETLGAWLDKQLPAILNGTYSSQTFQSSALARHYWMFENPAEYFLSFRGTHEEAAREWKERFEKEQKTTVRMVPAKEYSYETECVTLQQRWEGVARLMHEMRATGRVLLFMSDDYFDSFWTAAEFLTALWMKGRDPRTGKAMLDDTYFIRDPASTALQSFRDGMLDLHIPTIGSSSGMDRFVYLINNGDPLTSAPETQVPPEGLAKLLAIFVKQQGFYREEFMTSSYWNTVRVPCPHPTCRSYNRRPDKVDWDAVMQLPDDTPQTDYFGYFPVQWQELESGSVQCPHCHNTLRVVNRHGVRTLWMPVMTTESNQRRSPIVAHKIWEVVRD